MDRNKINMRKTEKDSQIIPDLLRGFALEKHVVI